MLYIFCSAKSKTAFVSWYPEDASSMISREALMSIRSSYFSRTNPAYVSTLETEGNNIWVRPETTGKGTQWGTLEEIVQLFKNHKLQQPIQYEL